MKCFQLTAIERSKRTDVRGNLSGYLKSVTSVFADKRKRHRAEVTAEKLIENVDSYLRIGPRTAQNKRKERKRRKGERVLR